jgi:Winged helix DNA-binding domain
MAERVLSVRELNRAALARQLLLERAAFSPVEVIEHLVGMQAQWPQSPYIGIWTRTIDFARADLERELAAGNVLKANLMRMTLHLVTRRDYSQMRAMLNESNHMEAWPNSRLVAQAVRELAQAGPITNADALALVERDFGLTGIEARLAWRGARQRAHILHHHETALWNGRPEGRFVAVDEPEEVDPLIARAEILRRFITAFGPVSNRDIDQWAMMRMPQIKPALDILEPLRRFKDERGRTLLDVQERHLPNPEVTAPVRFLPKWDNVLLAYADRTRILPEPYRRVVIKQNGDVAPTFLVDGFVAGIWRVDERRVVAEPFTKLTRADLREVEQEGARLQAFLDAT